MGGVKKFFNYVKGFFSAKKRTLTFFILSLFMIGMGAISASAFMSNFGDITITEVCIPTENGQYSTADIYRPKSATATNKAPAVIVVPGFQRTKETQVAYSLELARRGVVAICLDPYAQGDSSSSSSPQAATTQGYGLFAWVDYVTLTDNINYIDKEQVGAAGHSAGGNACVKAASKFGQEVVDGLRETSRLKAAYISGYVRSFTENDLKTVRSNMGMAYAYYDEGAYQNETQQMKDNGTWVHGDDIANGDMRYAPEAIRFVNSGITLNGEQAIDTVTGQIEVDKKYGNPFNYTYRIVHNEKTLHAIQPYDTLSISHMIEFFDYVFELDHNLSSSNQIWWGKEISQGVMLVGGFIFIATLGALLLKLNIFSSLVHQKPEPEKQDLMDKIFFWITFALSALIACFDFIPCAQLAQQWFATAQSGTLTWFFPQRMTNAILLWAVFNGLIGLVLFFSTHYLKKFIRAKKQNQKLTLKDDTSLVALKVSPKELLKTFSLALLVFAIFYFMVLVIYILLKVDFRFMFISARPILSSKLVLISLMYIPFFFIFYLSNSIRVCCSMNVSNFPKWLSILISVLANSVGLMLIMVIQYSTFAATGMVMYTTEWLYCNMLFSLIPMMMLLPVMNRYFFEKTGKAYLGPMITCLIFIFMTLTNTVSYIPL